ncbi:YfiR family protein [Photobacterium sp. TY1-4]|uniref:YfiR family protein n=1 Tax=Photobacterium sp. TY1-4 TaxID=2899122 RepID=UPI0021C0929D|nr:YfiR family protein [Photobacterium sp. TY1-4]UXI00188.1 YfiR family protein [Photobacterium sp. TY1-4]
MTYHHHSKPRWRRFLRLALFAIGLMPFPADTQDMGHTPPPSVASKARIKALYIYYFANFVRWPEQRHPNRFCTYGSDPVTATLHQLVERKNQPNKQFNIQTLDDLNSLSTQCDILYLTAERLAYLPVVPQIRGILTVSDSDVFLQKGGMIELRTYQHRIKPAIALEHVNRSELTISAHLLRIALLPANVKTGGRDE